MQEAQEIPQHKEVSRFTHLLRADAKEFTQKQRVTITLPGPLLERLRNAVYWTGHGTLALLITEALDKAVCQIEERNGQPFPERLAQLKRGRPSKKARHGGPFIHPTSN